MGAVLVCFGIQESDCGEIRHRSGKPTPSGHSLLDRLPTSWSCGYLDDEDEDPVKCVFMLIHCSVIHSFSSNHRFSVPPASWDAFMLQSNKSSASSGSRLLLAFYSRLLEENDDCAYYFDSRGKRMKGGRLELLEDYFRPLERKRSLSRHPIESIEMDSSSDDCFSMSSTLVSELDYWACSDPPRPVLGRCSSLGPPVHASLKIHRAVTSPHLQEAMYFAHVQSAKLGSHPFPSPKPYLPLAFAS